MGVVSGRNWHRKDSIILWESIATVPHRVEWAYELVLLCLDSYHSWAGIKEALASCIFTSFYRKGVQKDSLSCWHWQFSWAPIQMNERTLRWNPTQSKTFYRRIKRENSYPSPSKWIRVSLQRGRTKPMVQVLLQEKSPQVTSCYFRKRLFVNSFNTKIKPLNS